MSTNKRIIAFALFVLVLLFGFLIWNSIRQLYKDIDIVSENISEIEEMQASKKMIPISILGDWLVIGKSFYVDVRLEFVDENNVVRYTEEYSMAIPSDDPLFSDWHWVDIHLSGLLNLNKPLCGDIHQSYCFNITYRQYFNVVEVVAQGNQSKRACIVSAEAWKTISPSDVLIDMQCQLPL